MNLGTDLSWSYGGIGPKLGSGGALSEILAQKSWRPGLLVSTVPYLRQGNEEIVGEGSLDWRTYRGCFSSSSTESLHTPVKEVSKNRFKNGFKNCGMVTLSVVEDTVEGLAPETRDAGRRWQSTLGWGSCGNESILNNNDNLRVLSLSIIREAALQGLPMKHTFALAPPINTYSADDSLTFFAFPFPPPPPPPSPSTSFPSSTST